MISQLTFPSLSASLAALWRGWYSIVVIAAAMAVSCGAFATGVEVQFWTMQLSPFHDAYIRGVISSFEKQNPDVRVKWVDVP
ncbi:MAG: hypothetical protein ACK5VR_01765, partial [Burkholderiales bacterium]